MATPPETPETIDAGRLWAGGAVTALIAALAAFVVWTVATQVVDVELLVPESPGSSRLIELSGGRVVLVTVVVGLVATGLLHLMMLTLPRPRSFFLTLSLVVLAASAIPVLTADVSTTNLVWLLALHAVVAVFVLGLLLPISRAALPPPQRRI